MSSLINNRAHPAVELQRDVTVHVADLITERPALYVSGQVTAMDMPTLCQRLIAAGVTASHLQIFDATGGERVAMAFMPIASTAAWIDPEIIDAKSARRSDAGPPPEGLFNMMQE